MNYHSDNGPQFVSVEFRNFSRSYGFSHTTSSPHYPRGNGLVERTVQTVKNLPYKSEASGEDFHLALLAYRATPHQTTNVSPAQLLMGRRLRTTLPSVSSALRPVLVPRDTLLASDTGNKLEQATAHDQRKGARHLKELKPGDAVLMWDINTRNWRFPVTVQRTVGKRSYEVLAPTGKLFRRNRHQLLLRPSRRPIPVEVDFDDDDVLPEAPAPACAAAPDNKDWCDHEQVVGGENDILKAGEAMGVAERICAGRVVRPPAWLRDYCT